jgi:hypothetical protein
MRVTFLARCSINLRCINIRECWSQAKGCWWECVRSCWNIINACSSSSQTTARLNNSVLFSLVAMKFAFRNRATYVLEFRKMWHISLFPIFIMISNRTGITNVLRVYTLLKFRTNVQKSECFADRASCYSSKSNTNLIHFFRFLILVGFNASTCFGRHSPIFRRPCINVTWCNCLRKMCVGGVWVGVLRQHTFYARN